MVFQPGQRCGGTGDPDAFPRPLAAIRPEAGIRQGFPGDVVANPGPPRARGPVWLYHTGGEVLEMPHRISQKPLLAGRGGLEQPCQRGIGRWVGEKRVLIRSRIGRPRLVELEDGLGGFSLDPMELGAPQAVGVECPAILPRRSGDPLWNRRIGQPRARSVHDGRFRTGIHSASTKSVSFPMDSKILCIFKRPDGCAPGISG